MTMPARAPRSRVLTIVAMALLAVAAAIVIAIPLGLVAQACFAVLSIAGATALKRWRGGKGALALGLLALLVSTRYMVWRSTHTLPFTSPAEAVLGAGLYLAEIYAWLILVLGLIQTSWPLDRPVVPLDGEPAAWPTVDIYVPTYNESLEIVRTTVLAAMDLDYPIERYKVFILDDGKREAFREFAAEVGCGYITRDNNRHAKAGNMNQAMPKTDGELLAILDCDHVPTRAFLQLTLGWFQRDPRLALIQTPHHMYSPDPVQRNLSTMRDMAGEGDLFYGAVQSGNDLWNATFFCGSCAIIRREALAATNGFAGETVTEDAHTALKLQRMGWNTAYLGVRLSAGLATEKLVLHIGQRIRWARGMTQILRLDCPLLGHGLKWQQRLCYVNAMLHFQFPLPRIVFLTSPLAYLVFGLSVIHAPATIIFAYAMPHLICSNMLSERTQGGDRPPFWGEIYETILAFHLAPATILTLIDPRKGKFNVTDKGGLLDRTYFDWSCVKPQLVCLAMLGSGVIIGLTKGFLMGVPADALALNLMWAVHSMVILIAAVSVGRESKQVRQGIRIPAALPVTAYLEGGHAIQAVTSDVSMRGAALLLPTGLGTLTGGEPCVITHLTMDMGEGVLTVPVDTVRVTGRQAKLKFGELDLLAQRYLTRAVMGRADAWHPAAAARAVGGLRSIRDIAVVDLLTAVRLLKLDRLGRFGDGVQKPAWRWTRRLVALAFGSILLAVVMQAAREGLPLRTISLSRADLKKLVAAIHERLSHGLGDDWGLSAAGAPWWERAAAWFAAHPPVMAAVLVGLAIATAEPLSRMMRAQARERLADHRHKGALAA